MSESKPETADAWIDPDDAPELTDALLDIAEFAISEKVIRPATGYLGPARCAAACRFTIAQSAR